MFERLCLRQHRLFTFVRLLPGWLYKIDLTNPSELQGLMDEAAYKKFLENME